MRFLIISDAPTLKKEGKQYSYAPYVNEMNIWMNNFDQIVIVSPTKYEKKLLTSPFLKKIKVVSIPSLSFIHYSNAIKSLISLPILFYKIFINMYLADHIHLRSPGTIGLLASFIQVFFPSKTKTAKYAGNWDPKSKQPISYKIQKWILSNTLLTNNIKVLVYGNWAKQSKNIVPFFTASYSSQEIEVIEKKPLSSIITFLFVGTFTEGKQPLLSVKVIENLLLKGFNVKLEMFGEGEQYNMIKEYLKNNYLENNIVLHGNQSKEVVKEAYKKAHFLLFISKSEGWPKVVAEAMFWRCLPISSKVSCVEYMLDYNKRGSLVSSNVSIEVLEQIIIEYIENEEVYQKKVLRAQEWSQQYTIDKFSSEIKRILHE